MTDWIGIKRFACLVVLSLSAGLAIADSVVLKARGWLDVDSGRINEPALLVIEDDRIKSIDPEGELSGMTIIDAGDLILLPGFMDMHTHLASTPEGDWAHRRVTDSTAYYAMRSVFHARNTLMAGFTTVREVGAPDFVDVALSRATDKGWIDGPRIIPSGNFMGTTGGHCDETAYKPGVLEFGYREGIADGPDELVKAVRYQIKHGAKAIKICATAGVMSFEASPGAQQMTDEEMRAVVEEAHRHDAKVAAHAHGTQGIIAASNAGVDSVEHGSILNREAVDVLKKNGTYLVPTIFMWFLEYDLPPEIDAKNEYVKGFIDDSMRLAISSGVKIAFGTDAGEYEHGRNAEEFAALVERGMSPIDAIRTATVNTADLLDFDDRGRIAAGLLADIVGVPGNPLEDIRVTENVQFVMKGGKVYRMPE